MPKENTETRERRPDYIVPVKSFGHVKALGTRKCEGVGIRFGSPETKDGYGDYFTPLTQTGLRNGSDRPFLIDHWEDNLFAFKIIGEAVYERKDDGWAYEARVVDDEAGNMAFDLLTSGEYRSSTGSAWNYTKGVFTVNDAFMFTTWLVLEQSATKRPADFWNPPIQVKSLDDFKRLSSIISPLLDERTKHLLGIEMLEDGFKQLKSQVEVLETKIKTDATVVDCGIVLPDEINSEVERLLEYAKSIK